MKKKNRFSAVFIFCLSLVFLFLNASDSYAQPTRKDSHSRYLQLTKLTIDSLKSGACKVLANVQTIEEFMCLYVTNGRAWQSKKYGFENLNHLYSDTEYVYFVRCVDATPIDFIKVVKTDMDGIDLDAIDGREIRDSFVEQIVPIKDKIGVAQKKVGCMDGAESGGFTYQFLKATQELLITYKWKEKCEFITIINKTYIATYNIETHQFRQNL